jgi:hypothetical protein
MHAVVLIELATSIEAEAEALAACLGGTAYEHRQHLLGGLPCTVLTTADAQHASSTLRGLSDRGHAAVIVPGERVVRHETMRALRRFHFDTDMLVMDEPVRAQLPSEDILALIRAVHRSRTETRSEVTSKSFSVGRALMTGGLMTSKTVKREQHSTSGESQPVLYIFRVSDETPWILRERGTNYSGLGAELAPSSLQNFLATTRALRALAPRAAYDERLLSVRTPEAAPRKTVRADGEAVTSSTASSVDIAAHALAFWYRQRRIP